MFPSYTAGHAMLGCDISQIRRRFFGTDAVPLTFTSDEFNGVCRESSAGSPRPLSPHTFPPCTDAEQESAPRRVDLGIEWRVDETRGDPMGRGIANETFENVCQPKS